MFIKLADYIIPIDKILYIKIIGAGCRVVLETRPCNEILEISTVPEIELRIALDKLFLRRKDVQ